MGARLLSRIHMPKPGFSAVILAGAAWFCPILHAAPAGVTFSQSAHQVDRYDFVEVTV